jgi:multidrug resistance efflux pump
MSTESRYPVMDADGPRPNGSLSNHTVASVSHVTKTVRRDSEDVRRLVPAQPASGKGRARRIFRATAGVLGMVILLLVFAKWVLIPVVLPMTNDAWPNAPVITVRAPNEGNAQVRLEVGQAVEQGETVVVLSNRGVDPSQLARLRAELTMMRAEQSKRRSDLQVAKELEQLANRELEDYRNGLVARLTASLQETEARIKELTVGHQQSRRVLEMNRRLGTTGAISRDEWDRAAEVEAMAHHRLQQAQASRESTRIELEEAKRNVFVQRETPIYLTWHLQVRQTIPQLEAQLVETAERLAATEAELKQVEEHADRLAGSTVCSPVSGVIWRRNASWGPVAKGESLLEIAQTKGQFIQALFPESHARSLFQGARAVILFSGLPPFEGTVRAIRQSSPTDHDLASAIRLPRRLNQLEVLIDFDHPPGDASLLGRQCQVLAADRSNTVHALAANLFCLLRW